MFHGERYFASQDNVRRGTSARGLPEAERALCRDAVFPWEARARCGGLPEDEDPAVAADGPLLDQLRAEDECRIRDGVALLRLEPAALLTTLGVDSLSLLELMFKIEDRFHVKIPGDTPTNLVSISDLVAYIDELIASHPATSAPPAAHAHAAT